jgi:hypothetical protein
MEQSTHECNGHDSNHAHGPECGHERVRHGDHECYVVGDHLHHVQGGRCVDHGTATSAERV